MWKLRGKRKKMTGGKKNQDMPTRQKKMQTKKGQTNGQKLHAENIRMAYFKIKISLNYGGNTRAKKKTKKIKFIYLGKRKCWSPTLMDSSFSTETQTLDVLKITYKCYQYSDHINIQKNTNRMKFTIDGE